MEDKINKQWGSYKQKSEAEKQRELKTFSSTNSLKCSDCGARGREQDEVIRDETDPSWCGTLDRALACGLEDQGHMPGL